MKGIELCRQWYEAYGKSMLEQQFPDVCRNIACGVSGRGSLCFGFDDEISRDHDWHTGFTLWISDDDERRYGFALERAYRQLEKQFPPDICFSQDSRLGENGFGVMRISDFFRRHLGYPEAPENWQQWLYTPEYAFAEVLNGEIFRDDSGRFSAVRENIRCGMPEDVRLKKMASRAVSMAQSGQYNYRRCLKRAENAAARMALAEFAENTVSMVFLLNRRFAPYYKWMFRAMRDLPILSEISADLEFILTNPDVGDAVYERVEHVSAAVAEELINQGVSSSSDPYLEAHAFEMMSRIINREIRSLHIMQG